MVRPQIEGPAMQASYAKAIKNVLAHEGGYARRRSAVISS
jgi:hypothetical protein